MKKNIHYPISIVFLLILLLPAVVAQRPGNPVEVAPQYPGGENALYADVSAGGLEYPAEAKALGIQGQVVVQFVVETDGTVDEVIVLKDEIGYGAGEELARRVKNLKLFSPGTVDGVPTRCQFQLPVTYSLGTEKAKRVRSKWIRRTRVEAKK